MPSLIDWLKDPAHRWIEPRDVHGYLETHPDSIQTVNTPDTKGITPIEFLAGRGDGDMIRILLEYGAKRTPAAVDAFKRFIKENPEELDDDTKVWLLNLLRPRSAGRRSRKHRSRKTRKGTRRN